MPGIAIIREGQEPIAISGLHDGFTFDEKAFKEALEKVKDTIEHTAILLGVSVDEMKESLRRVIIQTQKYAGESVGMACKGSFDALRYIEEQKAREEILRKGYEVPSPVQHHVREYTDEEMCRKPDTVERVGSRRARLARISTFGRRGAAEWMQKQERPKKYLDCRKTQRRWRRKK